MDKPDKITELRAIVSAAFAAVTALIGWVGWLIVIMLLCMALDYLTGTWAAMSKNEWSSKTARAGLWHKLGEICALLVAALCDIAIDQMTGSGGMSLPFEYTALATPVVAVWYIFTELGSIAENAAKLGAPIPGWLKNALAAVRSAADGGDTSGGKR